MPDDEGVDSIGGRIAAARKLCGFTQQQLAERVPCSKSLIAQVERGHKLLQRCRAAEMEAVGGGPAGRHPVGGLIRGCRRG